MPVKENDSLYLGGVTRIDFQSGFIIFLIFSTNKIIYLIILMTLFSKNIIL